METTPSLSVTDEDLQSFVTQSVDSVFSTMLSTNAAFEKTVEYSDTSKQPVEQPFDTSQNIVASSVSFVGKVNGTIFLYINEELSVTLASKMLGLTPDEVKAEGFELVNDTLGEIANMTVGGFKNKICSLGYDCSLTIPSIVRGKNLQVTQSASFPVIRRFYRFDIEGSPFIFDLLLKKE